jgi:hypothetical protein
MTGHSDKTKGRSLNRRRFIATGLTSLPLLSVRSFSKSTSEEETPGQQEVPLSRSVKALAFDVFGTVVDWRSSIIREGQLLTKMKGLQVDWARFADEWRDGYGPAMDMATLSNGNMSLLVDMARNAGLPWDCVLSATDSIDLANKLGA